MPSNSAPLAVNALSILSAYDRCPDVQAGLAGKRLVVPRSVEIPKKVHETPPGTLFQGQVTFLHSRNTRVVGATFEREVLVRQGAASKFVNCQGPEGKGMSVCVTGYQHRMIPAGKSPAPLTIVGTHCEVLEVKEGADVTVLGGSVELLVLNKAGTVRMDPAAMRKVMACQEGGLENSCRRFQVLSPGRVAALSLKAGLDAKKTPSSISALMDACPNAIIETADGKTIRRLPTPAASRSVVQACVAFSR
jgi:hypothetical protein